MFKFNNGLYETYCNPLTINQLKDIYLAASECNKLYILLKYDILKDPINYKLRYRWLNELCKQFNNTKIILSKKEIPKKIDITYNKEKHTTKIHENPFKYWQQIPNIIKEYYVKKVLIIGNESTGKTVLCESLANIYNTKYIKEYSREVALNCCGEDYMLEEDFEKILYQHKINIINGTKEANKLLFIDTDAFMTYYYRNQCIKHENDRILEKEENIKKISNQYDLVLFMESDVPYIDDELRINERNQKKERLKLTKKIKKLYKRNNINYEIITGNYKQRLEKTIKIINERFDNL